MKTKSNRLIPAVALPLLFAGAIAWAQKADPFLVQKTPEGPRAVIVEAGPPSQNDESGRPEALVQMEWISLSPAAARTALRKYPAQADLYQWLQEELDKGDGSGVKLEWLDVLRVRSGSKSKIESLLEFPYPTEFDPAEIPQSVGLGVGAAPINKTTTTVTPAPPVPTPPTPPGGGARGEAGPAGTMGGVGNAGASFDPGFLKTHTTAQSFEFKNLGWSEEMELVISNDGQIADLNYAPQFNKFVKHVSYDKLEETSQPIFKTQKLATQILARVGQPTFAGTMSPAPDTGVAGGEEEPRVWMHFITVNLTR